MSDMLKLLKLIDKAEKPILKETVSLSINATGESSCDVTDMLSKIMQLSGMKQRIVGHLQMMVLCIGTLVLYKMRL